MDDAEEEARACRHCECVEEGLDCCICGGSGVTTEKYWWAEEK